MLSPLNAIPTSPESASGHAVTKGAPARSLSSPYIHIRAGPDIIAGDCENFAVHDDRIKLTARAHNNGSVMGEPRVRKRLLDIKKASRLYRHYQKDKILFVLPNGRSIGTSLEGNETDSWGYEGAGGTWPVRRPLSYLWVVGIAGGRSNRSSPECSATPASSNRSTRLAAGVRGRLGELPEGDSPCAVVQPTASAMRPPRQVPN